jgi:hypothetical protein
LSRDGCPKNLENLIQSIRAKKDRLDRLRPLSGGALAELRKFYDVELTYTSNAIEPKSGS